MKVHWLALLVIIGLACAVPVASAKIVEEKDGYVVSTVDASERFATFSSLGTYTLTQGQTRWHTASVPSGATTYRTDLNWGTPANSLSLTLYTPDTSSLGPYYDTVDGQADGRIYLSVYRSTGIPFGSWSGKVYGSSISGTQAYSYSAYGY